MPERGQALETGVSEATAIVFPGMGPMRYDETARFMLINRYARELTAVADEVLGDSLLDRYHEATGDYSEYAQVAFLIVCLALARWAEETSGLSPVVCAGPSFGGKAAAAYTGVLSVEEAIWLTVQRARVLERYFSSEHTDVITHSFARTPPDVLAALQAELDADGEWHEMSCHVDDDLYMISVRERVSDRLTASLRAKGALPLYVMRPPMHCSVFGGLRELMDTEVLAQLTFADPAIPIVADQDGRLVRDGAGVRAMLSEGFVRPVRWPSVVATLVAQGVQTVYVSGPDSLFGRVGVTTRNVHTVPISPRTALRPRRRRAFADAA